MKKLIFAFICLFLVVPSQARILYVDANASGANSGSSWVNAYKYLQDALIVAEPNDSIWVAQGTYRPDEDTGHPAGTNDRTATFQLKNGVALYGGFPAGGGFWGNRDPNTYVTSLSGDIGVAGNKGDNSYHVVTGSGTNSTAILDGFTITAGFAYGSSSNKYGAGMYNSSGSPTIINCTFSGNTAQGEFISFEYTLAGYGGGMYNDGSSPTITNCTFTGNSAQDGHKSSAIFPGHGGGMYNKGGRPILTNCTFSGNSAHNGGGMFNNSSSPTLTNCTFTVNSADEGGGMYNDHSSPTVTNCTFSGNEAQQFDGGGMFNLFGNPTLTNCIFTGNSASDGGGGICCSSSSPTVTNCTFSGNSADSGGGMHNSSGNPTITNCTFTGNSAYTGGGMYSNHNSPTITSCTFSGNSAEAGGGMFNYNFSSPAVTNCTFSSNSADDGGGMYNYYRSNPTLASCILWGNTAANGQQIYNSPGSTSTVSFSDIQGGWAGTGNINTDPCFVNAAAGDLHLSHDSPCINAGDPNYIPGPNETDLDGLPRIIGGRIDMGAYEFNHRPVADAGPNQVVYADHTGLAAVTLDGSASYDDDGQDLTYKWTWTIDGNTFTTSKGTDGIVNMLDFAAFAKQWPQSENPFADLSILTKAWLSTPASPNWNRQCDIAPAGAVLTIELPVGEHTIELLVSDGIDESEPDYCTITVIGAVRGRLTISPRVLETKSRGKWILATLYLPPVADEQVNTEEPLRLYPGGIKAEHQRFFRYGRPGRSYTIALAFFDKQQVIDALEGPDKVEVSVVGRFLTGRYFFGSDTIKIIAPPHRPPHHWH